MEAFDLYSPAIDANPFPYYDVLRERHPCYWSESGNLWILSRYDDIVQAARDWETFSSSQGNMIDELPGRAGATLGTTDPPRHDRLRALSQAVAPNNRDGFAQQHLVAVDATIDDMFHAVTIVNPGGSYTLATEHSPLPLVLRNDLPVPIRVEIDLATPPGMTVSDIGVQELPPG